MFTCTRQHGVASQQSSQWWIPLPRETSVLERTVEVGWGRSGTCSHLPFSLFLSIRPLVKWTFVSKWHQKAPQEETSISRTVRWTHCRMRWCLPEDNISLMTRFFLSASFKWTVNIYAFLFFCSIFPLYLAPVSLHSRCTIHQPCSPQRSAVFKKRIVRSEYAGSPNYLKAKQVLSSFIFLWLCVISQPTLNFPHSPLTCSFNHLNTFGN